ncbi:uncharacterized protein DUF4249 [Salegentibacter sp. 24]|uniref:DUF4249 domain-containing protein n=1 Tax=Salegentibacter sp. 24 TaxID=2183986 RepID=UPI00105CE6E1|nr:DUF4249 domain-containing protein [Salegentibacter sp. 24]TDN78555.1 uncharacterized protein DUF4249 [Salegentibacter sp. 24]
MFISKNIKVIGLLIFTLSIMACVEEIPLEPEGFEEAIVIEGMVTNELKKHEIKLSRAFEIDSSGPNPLSGAEVKVIGNNEYVFEEKEPGIYISRDSFAAQPGINYQLKIFIEDEKYQSEPMQLPGTSGIAQIEANRIDYQGENGIAITLNNQTSSGEANYYKYEYSETFKFNSRYYKTRDLILIDGRIVEVPKIKEEYTCYRTEESQQIILANTNSLSENNVNNLLLTFIANDEPKLALRYSIFVEQYVISRGAYNYYAILEELSDTDNVFSQSQPGFFAGNIENVNNPDEKIIGFFDISSVSKKRIFFNYDDFFDSPHPRPYFASYCPIENPNSQRLKELLQNGAVKWFTTDPILGFKVVPVNCVDCTVFGTNEVPEFWEE